MYTKYAPAVAACRRKGVTEWRKREKEKKETNFFLFFLLPYSAQIFFFFSSSCACVCGFSFLSSMIRFLGASLGGSIERGGTSFQPPKKRKKLN
jgi:hypothetical protein